MMEEKAECKLMIHMATLNLELARTNRRLVERNAELSEKVMKLRGQRGWMIRQCRYLDKQIEEYKARVLIDMKGGRS